MRKGLALGIYAKEKDDGSLQFINAGDKFDKLVSGKVRELLALSGPLIKVGKTHVFSGLHQHFPIVVVAGLGKKIPGIDALDNWNKVKYSLCCSRMHDCQLAHINNIGKYRSFGAWIAAISLKEFVAHSKWAHLDIAGVMANKDGVPYLKKGMSGRSTRTLTEFLFGMNKDKENSE